MAFSSSDLDNVERAIATGATRVEIDGRVVIYQRLADLFMLRDQIRGELGESTPATSRGRAWNPTTSNGL